MVHKDRRDEAEKHEKKFQRNSDHDMNEKILENFDQNPKWQNIESDRETEAEYT